MHTLKSTLRRFIDNEEGSVTVEFIIVMPMLVFWWIGSMVFYDAFDARAGAARVAHVIADNVSRQVDTNANQIDNLLTLQNRMLPREPVGVVRVSQIFRDNTGTLSVEWSYATSGPVLSTPDHIPTAIMPPMANEQRILLIDTYVPYIPLAQFVGFTASTWENRVYTNARFVDNLPFVVP